MRGREWVPLHKRWDRRLRQASFILLVWSSGLMVGMGVVFWWLARGYGATLMGTFAEVLVLLGASWALLALRAHRWEQAQ
jgi:hypothetical protein